MGRRWSDPARPRLGWTGQPPLGLYVWTYRRPPPRPELAFFLAGRCCPPTPAPFLTRRLPASFFPRFDKSTNEAILATTARDRSRSGYGFSTALSASSSPYHHDGPADPRCCLLVPPACMTDPASTSSKHAMPAGRWECPPGSPKRRGATGRTVQASSLSFHVRDADTSRPPISRDPEVRQSAQQVFLGSPPICPFRPPHTPRSRPKCHLTLAFPSFPSVPSRPVLAQRRCRVDRKRRDSVKSRSNEGIRDVSVWGAPARHARNVSFF